MNIELGKNGSLFATGCVREVSVFAQWIQIFLVCYAFKQGNYINLL